MNALTDERKEYLLFTRINRGDELIHAGSLKAESDDLAKVYAQHIYNEEDWAEMYVLKKDALICIRKPEPLFSKE